jgi:hypothetical protein
MINFRLKQIGLALCLMASLLVGSASACMCSHHQEKTKSSETSCHGNSHEQPVENIETPTDGDAVDVDCVCFVNQPQPLFASKSEAKKVKIDRDFAILSPLLMDRDLIPLVTTTSLPATVRLDTYKHVFERAKPSRAPPRL